MTALVLLLLALVVTAKLSRRFARLLWSALVLAAVVAGAAMLVWMTRG